MSGTCTRIVLLATALALVPSMVGAQSYGTELPFILGTGARASAMGASGTSLTGDASVQFYNPSMLSSVQWKQFSFYRTRLFDSRSHYHSLTYSHPLLGRGTLGLSVMRVDVGGIEERDANNQLLSEDLHDAQTRVLLGYGTRIGSSLQAGFNVVLDNQSFGAYSASGFGIDVGLSAQQHLKGRSFIRGLRQGFVIRNLVEPSLKLDQEKVSDPLHMALGLSVLSNAGNGLAMVTSIDLVNPRFSPLGLRVGQEVTYQEKFSMRVGVDDATPTFGFGAAYRNLAFDYAYRSEDFGDNHRLSLSVRFGASISERQTRARLQREREVDETISIRMSALERAQVERALDTGTTLLSQSDFDGAISHFDIALLWDPQNTHARDGLTEAQYRRAVDQGRRAMTEDDCGRALVHLRRALDLVPNDSTTTRLIGQCETRIAASRNTADMVSRMLKSAIDLYAEQHFTDALGGFEEVLRIAPDNSFAREYRDKCRTTIAGRVQRLTVDARSAAARDEYDTAVRLLSTALDYRPGDPTLRSELEDIQRQASRARAAAQRDERSTRAEKSTPSTTRTVSIEDRARLERRYRDGISLFEQGEFDRAIDALTEVWTQHPEFPNVTTFLAKAYLFVGMNYYSDQNYALAIANWERALTVEPDNGKAKRYLSKANEEIRKLNQTYEGQ